MYQPTDLKKGTVCQIDGKPYRVVEYSQKVMGRGGSIVNVKLKNLTRSFINIFNRYCLVIATLSKSELLWGVGK